jgi:hypothetical protein
MMSNFWIDLLLGFIIGWILSYFWNFGTAYKYGWEDCNKYRDGNLEKMSQFIKQQFLDSSHPFVQAFKDKK